MTVLETPDNTYADVRAINNSGRVVGYARSVPEVALLWDHGQVVQLPALDEGFPAHALAINSAGLIAGESRSLEHTNWRPVLWDESGIRDLGTLRSDNSGTGWASDINDAGYVVGNAEGERYSSRAFIWRTGEMHDLDPGGDRDMVALSINDHNEVVGQASNQPFYWDEQRGVQWLRDLAPPRSRWIMIWSHDINDSSVISATGSLRTDHLVLTGFQLFPVHPTLLLGQAVPGMAGQANSFTVTGATPGATVGFYYGPHGGGSFIPGCSPRSNALQIDDPRLMGTAIADEAGTATFTQFVSSRFQNDRVLIQAVIRGECAISQLVVQRFE